MIRSRILGRTFMLAFIAAAVWLTFGVGVVSAATCDSWLGSSYCGSLIDGWGDTWDIGIKPYSTTVEDTVYADYFVSNSAGDIDEIAIDINQDCTWSSLATDPCFEWSSQYPPSYGAYSLDGKIPIGTFDSAGIYKIYIYGFLMLHC